MGGLCVDYRVQAETPVPLEGLAGTEELFAITRSEFIEGADLNGDGDITDPAVLQLRDRSSGAGLFIGAGGALGRVVARVNAPPFEFPALVAAGDVVAFLEPEPLQGIQDAPLQQDVNANASIFETNLRAYRVGGGTATEITDPGGPPSADAALLVDGRSLALSDGLVFFRAREAAHGLQETVRVSVDSSGNQSTGATIVAHPVVSADGRFVAFTSDSGNLVVGDTNGDLDVFVHDLETGETVMVSVNTAGVQGNLRSQTPALSADGRFVAFLSQSSNLDPGATFFQWRVYVHDRDTDEDGIFDEAGSIETTLVHVNSAGVAGNDGASPNNVVLSADGQVVAFTSLASNLVVDDTTTFIQDVFVHDRATGETSRVSVGPGGVEADTFNFAPDSISADGRFVVWTSFATNLVANDTNGTKDVFVHDRVTQVTERISVNSSGGEANDGSGSAAMSADGRYVVFSSVATNLGDVGGGRAFIFVRDRLRGETIPVDATSSGLPGLGPLQPGGAAKSDEPAISADGRFVAFSSVFNNLVTGDTNSFNDIFLRDLLTGQTTRVSLGSSGLEATTGTSTTPAMSGDARVVAFMSGAADLVAGDTNGNRDIFVRTAATGDVTGDSRPDDTLLYVLDTLTASPTNVATACPAATVSTASGNAAFLRPEDAGATASLPQCPSGPTLAGDLNDDGDTQDEIVHLWTSGVVQNLECAATAISLSDTHLAALVSECDE
ncbi:MAG: TolB family protein, partial [Candidatus Binatia bacterium]